MCHKCNWIEVDGIQAHVNGDLDKMDPETLEALKSMIKIAYNYTKMKELLSQQNASNEPNRNCHQ